ncbi:larval cuticle protein 65Ag1-like [Daphnia pulex]|uniref:larval cuticle protein 65Ag1-like n=1 Tax=Daphnia pulex TaxID=6669 RepID=UPI001EDF3A8B|nr:larval cuticle protein 65Ag1-like [Daphnia pulex]
MKLFVIAAILAVAAAVPSSYSSYEKKYEKDYKYPEITVTGQSDERNLDGSSKWNYAQSDYTTRDETQEQKKFTVTTVDDYGKEYTEEVYGNTNKGSSYWVSPEGEKFTLTWAADNAGFQPKGDHLPVAPVHVYELPVAPVHEYVLPVAPVHEYELPVAPVHIPFNGKGFKIY